VFENRVSSGISGKEKAVWAARKADDLTAISEPLV
jgi:hypothetical protein